MSLFDKFFIQASKSWVTLLYSLGIFLLILYVDRPLTTYFFDLHLKSAEPAIYWAVYCFTQLGLGILYLIGFLLAALFFRYHHKNRLWEIRFWFLWASALLSSCVCVILKVLFGRARPDLWFGTGLYGFYGFKLNSLFWSFPSGHTSTVMGIVFGIAVLFPRYERIAMLFGILIAISRVVLFQHYLSDVAAAAWLALIEIAMLRWAVLKWHPMLLKT